MPTNDQTAPRPAALPAHTEPANQAARMNAAFAALETGDAPYTAPGPGQIVVRNHAVAVNPLEWIIQVAGTLAYRWLDYPAVIGSDVAGEVVQVGPDVTRFAVGDRVIGHAVGTDKDVNSPSEGAFQLYTVVLERMASPIPDDLAYEDAAVLPLAVSTASCALFQADQLDLARPTADPAPTGQTVLVWGGSTSVGSQAIQLAVAAGYEVITTCSPRNFAYVTGLGAALAFDYNSPDAIDDIVAAFAGRNLAGAIAFGTTSAPACIRIVARCQGRKFVSMGTPPVSFEALAPEHKTRLTTVRVIRRMITSNVGLQLRARTHGVGLKYIFGTSLKHNDVSTTIYRDFLPAALAEGRYAAVPAPRIVGDGLHDLQKALDIQRRGVSAAKIVVALKRPAADRTTS